MFYREWALGETLIKTMGVGLGFELQWLAVAMSPLNLDVGPGKRHSASGGRREEEWGFKSKNDEHHLLQ